jgi:hypothetical protein
MRLGFARQSPEKQRFQRALRATTPETRRARDHVLVDDCRETSFIVEV